MHYLFRFCYDLFTKTESVTKTSINGQVALVLFLLSVLILGLIEERVYQ